MTRTPMLDTPAPMRLYQVTSAMPKARQDSVEAPTAPRRMGASARTGDTVDIVVTETADGETTLHRPDCDHAHGRRITVDQVCGCVLDHARPA